MGVRRIIVLGIINYIRGFMWPTGVKGRWEIVKLDARRSGKR